jgi:peroxiredoxin Q/BCP
MLKISDPAPPFSCVNQHGQTIKLSDYAGKKNLVLYFYPKDDTPGCTIEANEFSSLIKQFDELDTVILGVSKDDCASHQAFINKFSLEIDLLSDTDGELCTAYGVWQEKEKNGEKKMGIVRSTFVIDKSGIIVAAEYGVQAEGHAQSVLAEIKNR